MSDGLFPTFEGMLDAFSDFGYEIEKISEETVIIKNNEVDSRYIDFHNFIQTVSADNGYYISQYQDRETTPERSDFCVAVFRNQPTQQELSEI